MLMKKTTDMRPDGELDGRVFRHAFLLVVLMAIILLEPLAGSGFTTAIFLGAMAVVAALLDGEKARTKVAVVFMAVPAVILIAAQFLPPSSSWRAGLLQDWPVYVFRILVIAALAYCGLLILMSLLGASRVSANEILGTISLFLVLAFIWSFAYELLEHLHPGSFGLIESAPVSDVSVGLLKERSLQFVYFSFVTQTTLGFGDITPHSSMARRLVSMQAVMGQFYMAVVVAYLISIFITQRKKEE